MSNVLVTGSKGQLGLEIVKLRNDFSGFNFFFTDSTNLDITITDSIENYIVNNKIDVIINCAAYTNVDKAEDESELANEINHIAIKKIAEIAKKHQIKLIHISTDYVFDGMSENPYLEKDLTNPQNVYGSSKLKGEKAIQEINPSNSMIIRTSWLYSKFGNNFVKTILRLSQKKNQVSVVNDQTGSPTNGSDLANAILEIIPKIKNDSVELYHYANKGKCSWFHFAKEIIKLSKNECEVVPVSSSEFKSKANRPNFSLLNTDKIQKKFDIVIPHWKDSLKGYFSEE